MQTMGLWEDAGQCCCYVNRDAKHIIVQQARYVQILMHIEGVLFTVYLLAKKNDADDIFVNLAIDTLPIKKLQGLTSS